MSQSRASHRSAITLFELLLVLAILVAMAGVAIPTFASLVGSRRLGESISKLNNEIMSGRVTAMRTGQAQVLRMTLQGKDYSISPWLNGSEAQDASAGATIMQSGQVIETQSTTGGGATSSKAGSSKQLLEGVTFSSVETLVDSRNALAIQQSGGVVPAGGGPSQGDGSGLSSPLLLYPDGSCTTAQIILADAQGKRMAIQIRGVTGQLRSMRLTAIATP